MAGTERVIRAFVAIDLPDRVKEHLSELMKSLVRDVPDGVKWVNAYGVHITLKFLGDVRETQIPDLEKVIREVAGKYGSFSLFLKGCGAFPSIKKARVIWVGVDGDVGLLGDFKKELDNYLEPLGFPEEDREFRPHVTLGRVRRPSGNPSLAKSIASRMAFKTDFFTVEDVVLYQSILKPDGAEYRPIARIRLGGV
ncbi:RNA 2',3'-cyclic phosphodiesterase [Thermodesulforhabdus norvegica]|uniref:RNA 2',3'-cyclic phosphodiesterase n=1 Tax=Thermodesulforhabdus norvegica TaxID=39841 RepID=A0A1I4VKU5_9BACT|nr:RNA 2',3'-cyclic phosphodiesterase [Thermodesulforhabdus norvegica]SFN01872.1 2'-5' RNA ligase [Thermodesulforhabdus norvegica]